MKGKVIWKCFKRNLKGKKLQITIFAAQIVRKEVTSFRMSIKFFGIVLISVNFLIDAIKGQKVEKLSGKQ